MRKFNCMLLFVLAILPSMLTHAQGMLVIGGNAKAQECYENARLVGTLEFIGGLIEPCHYALKHVKLSRHDRAATLANRGIILTREESFDEALSDFKSAISLNPDAAGMYVNRGNVFFYENDFEMAISDYSMAMEMAIDDTHIAYLNRGLAYEGIGNGVKAEADYRQALAFNPQWQLAEDILGRFLAKQQESRQAPK